MKKDFSPEERLLRLIRKGKKKEAPKEEPTVNMPHPGTMHTPGRQEKARPETARAITIPFPFRIKEFNSRILNITLIVIFVGLLLYFMVDLFYTSYYEKEPAFLTGEGKAPEAEREKPVEVKPYSFYSAPIKGRNIFMPQQVDTGPVITGPTLEEVSANLSLIGIIAGERPQAIIENKKTGKSSFLYKGGRVNGTRIVEIHKDSVIMEYQGETFELFL